MKRQLSMINYQLTMIILMAVMLFVGQVMAQGGPPYDGTGATEGDSPIDVGNVTTYSIHGLSEDVILLWDANTEPDLKGYKVYYKIGTDGRIFFVVTAYDTENLESGFSNEVSTWDKYTGVPPAAPTLSGNYSFNLTIVLMNDDGTLTITLPDNSVINITP